MAPTLEGWCDLVGRLKIEAATRQAQMLLEQDAGGECRGPPRGSTVFLPRVVGREVTPVAVSGLQPSSKPLSFPRRVIPG